MGFGDPQLSEQQFCKDMVAAVDKHQKEDGFNFKSLLFVVNAASGCAVPDSYCCAVTLIQQLMKKDEKFDFKNCILIATHTDMKEWDEDDTEAFWASMFEYSGLTEWNESQGKNITAPGTERTICVEKNTTQAEIQKKLEPLLKGLPIIDDQLPKIQSDKEFLDFYNEALQIRTHGSEGVKQLAKRQQNAVVKNIVDGGNDGSINSEMMKMMTELIKSNNNRPLPAPVQPSGILGTIGSVIDRILPF